MADHPLDIDALLASGATMWRITTSNSIYELDLAERRMRRIVGTNAPTANQGDGGWKSFEAAAVTTEAIVIVWGVDRTGAEPVTRRARTSKPLTIEAIA